MRTSRGRADGGRDVPLAPFSVRAIMIEQNNIPFRGKPVKSAYMWRDIERRAAMYGLHPKLPVEYPLPEFDLANRIAVVGENEGWCAPYIRAAYRRWFEEGQTAGSEPNVTEKFEGHRARSAARAGARALRRGRPAL